MNNIRPARLGENITTLGAYSSLEAAFKLGYYFVVRDKREEMLVKTKCGHEKTISIESLRRDPGFDKPFIIDPHILQNEIGKLLKHIEYLRKEYKTLLSDYKQTRSENKYLQEQNSLLSERCNSLKEELGCYLIAKKFVSSRKKRLKKKTK